MDESLNPYRPPRVDAPERVALGRTPPEVEARRAAIRSLGKIWIAMGAALAFLTFFPLWMNSRNIAPTGQLAMVGIGCFGLFCAAAGVGLARLAPWIRPVATISAVGVSLVLPVLGLGLGVYLLYLLYTYPGPAALGLEEAIDASHEPVKERSVAPGVVPLLLILGVSLLALAIVVMVAA